MNSPWRTENRCRAASSSAVAGPLIGATIAVMLVGLVRGLPDKEEREAAEGGALPLSTQQTTPN